MTWRGADPPRLAPATRLQRLAGAARVAAALAATLGLLAPFLLGRLLHDRVSKRIRFHFPLATLWARLCLASLGVAFRRRGRPMAQGGVLTANHASWADILALAASGPVTFVSKAEVRDWPGAGTLAALAGTLFIERRRSAAKRQQAELLARVRAGELLCVFPEGTSSDGRRVLPFRSSLLAVLFVEEVRERAWVQPVTLNWLAPPDQPPELYAWWGGMPFERHVWDVACLGRGGAVEVTLHAPSPAAAFADRKALTRACEQTVRAAKSDQPERKTI